MINLKPAPIKKMKFESNKLNINDLMMKHQKVNNANSPNKSDYIASKTKTSLYKQTSS